MGQAQHLLEVGMLLERIRERPTSHGACEPDFVSSSSEENFSDFLNILFGSAVNKLSSHTTGLIMEKSLWSL